MRIQFINRLPLHAVSGGNIYNRHIINGLKDNGLKVDYNSLPLDKNYDISMVDSLSMVDLDTSRMDISKPIIALIHQIPQMDKNHWAFFRQHAQFVVTGSPTRKTLIEKWHIREENIAIVRPGMIGNVTKKKAYRKRPQRVIVVANFIKNKGYEILIGILKQLGHLDLEFTIIGNKDLDSGYAKEVIRAVNEIPTKRIQILYGVNEEVVYEQLYHSDVFLGLSQSETFGMAIFEALSIGVPCIAYKTGDYEYFGEFPNYHPIEKYSTSDFIKTLKGWYERPELYRSHCRSAERAVRDWNQVTEAFLMLIQNTWAL